MGHGPLKWNPNGPLINRSPFQGSLMDLRVSGGHQSQRAGVELRIWLKQGEEKSLLARILKILEEAHKRLS